MSLTKEDIKKLQAAKDRIVKSQQTIKK